MAKYKLKALSINLAGKLYKKEQGMVFDTDKNFKAFKAEIESAYKAGFFEKVATNVKSEKKDK